MLFLFRKKVWSIFLNLFFFFEDLMKLDVSDAIFVLKNKIWSIFQNLFCISFFLRTK